MTEAAKSVDVAVVGAGIVGLATAMHLLAKRPDLSVVLLEKEGGIAQHQTGHNSGVIHRGVYYAPGSLKARFCVEGARRLTAFCDEAGVPYRLVGKLIVAAEESELPALEELHRRGVANGVEGLTRISSDEIRDLEPNAVGIAALHSPMTGIVDFVAVAEAYRRRIVEHGGRLELGSRVDQIEMKADHVAVDVGGRLTRASAVVTCAGLFADRVAAMTGREPEASLKIVPFRGDYHVLRPKRPHLVRGLIYPVPDPRFPFLGVHFTPRMDGTIWVGPNAVLAFSREGYRLRDVSVRDLADTLTYPGFLRMALRYWRTGAQEMWRGVSRGAYARALRKYVPALDDHDLASYASGVRAQAVATDGSLVDDFSIAASSRVVHVMNAPSPAATSSLAIGEHIAERVLSALEAA